ncbi:MAG TPA: hypothetical protein VGD69_26360 [Herpetosiphonaceae bacterium]
MKYHTMARFAFVLGLLGCVFAVPAATNAKTNSQDVGIQSVSCYIDLFNNTHNCPIGSAISFVSAPSGGKTVVKLTLNPFTTGYNKAAFDIYYGSTPVGWSVNIGDSITNDGGGGDAATQSNDSETQIVNSTLTLHGNQAISGSSLYTTSGAASAGNTTRLEVFNQQLNVYVPGNPGGVGIGSIYTYALAGQYDSEGSVNYDIYAAFNRTVAYRADRLGSGVTSVGVTLYP